MDIATKAHLLGHFQVESTLSRLKEEYHWKNMLRDVERVVSQCEECRKDHRVVPMEHPAKALNVNGIFDRVGMDLTFGLPVTKEGFNGLLVITEYLTKYPYAVPIKSKTAEEIAEKLLVYISLFGPPKTILSDQGTEFNNAVVDKLVKATGVERRITSAYHPRTNGQTERFNYTFVEALRKYASEDNENWPKWVPFVLMAFRSRIHSTTGYTHFELMFGRKMNTFSDWRDNNDGNMQDSIVKRASEIRKMIETDHTQARSNIEKRQEHQRKSQNSQHRITMDVVPIGTKVYISTTGMHNKLFPKYRGPFTVVAYTDGGNYIVANAMKERLEDSFPLQRLKIVKKTDDEQNSERNDNFVRVEKIVESRKRKDGEYEYFVKYKDCPASENEWVQKEDFTDVDMINEYWKVEKGLKEKRKPGRPPKIRTTNLIYVCIVLFLLLKGIAGIRIEDDFYYCSGDHDTLWRTPFVDVESGCRNLDKAAQGTSRWLIPNTEYNTVHVLAKAVHQVHRPGYECHKSIRITTTYENFFGAKETVINSTILTLTRDACLRMVDERTCEGAAMVCDEISCLYQPEINIEHHWLTTQTQTDYSCVFSKKVVIAKDVNSNVFGMNCKVSDLYCSLKQAIIVWNDVKQECSLRKTKIDSKFKHKDRDILVQDETNLVLAITNKTTECDLTVYATKEGLYVTFDRDANKLEETDEVNIASIHEIMLAEADGEKFATAKAFETTQNQICENFATFLRNMKYEDERYDIFEGIDGKTRVLYSKNGIIFLPKCIKVDAIEVDEHTTQCFEHLLVNFVLNDTTFMKGYLLENRIIVVKDRIVDCKEKIIYKHLRKQNALLIRNKIGAIEIKNDIHTLTLASIQEHYEEIIFPHHKGIFQVLDIMYEIIALNFATVNENDKVTNDIVKIGNNTKIFGVNLPNVQNKLNNMFNSISSTFHDFKITLLTTFLILSLIALFILLLYLKCKKRTKNKNIMNFFRYSKTTENNENNNLIRASAPLQRIDSFTAQLLLKATQKEAEN